MTNPGMDAVATSTYTTVTATTPAATVDDTGIDEWELKASRRILANLRTLLLGQPMLDLIKDQVEESDRNLKGYLAKSDGEFTGTQVIVTIAGLRIREFMPILRETMGAAGGSDEEVRRTSVEGVFPMHPEHYVMLTGGRPGGIETMGGLPTRSHPAFVRPEDVPGFVSDLIDEKYDLSTVGSATLEDGTVFTYVLQEYRDTPEGMEASLRIWYPAACPPAYVEEHAEHYAVEFRNGARIAAAKLHAAG